MVSKDSFSIFLSGGNDDEINFSLGYFLESLSVTSEILSIAVKDLDLFKIDTPAELVILDPNKEWEFSPKNIFSKSKNSPFIGENMMGKIITTIVK